MTHYPFDVQFAGPSVIALRERAGSLCVDDECKLSGYFAHAGPCEPCSCGLRHAVAECAASMLDIKRHTARVVAAQYAKTHDDRPIAAWWGCPVSP